MSFRRLSLIVFWTFSNNFFLTLIGIADYVIKFLGVLVIMGIFRHALCEYQ